MKFWFDCEFTGLRKDTTLISIGIICEDNREFYAEFCDFNKDCANNKWMIDNVFANTMRVSSTGKFNENKKPEWEKAVKMHRGNGVCFGDKAYVRHHLIEWLDYWRGDTPAQFISDVCHYDMVLLIDLLSSDGTAFGMPSWVSPVCYDINQDIASHYDISDVEAFNMNREDIAKELIPDIYSSINFPEDMKHNALWDAQIIQAIYKALENTWQGIKEEDDYDF